MTIMEELEYDNDIIWDTSKSDGQLKKTISIDKLKRLHSDVHFCSLREGLKETVQWFLKNLDYCRK